MLQSVGITIDPWSTHDTLAALDRFTHLALDRDTRDALGNAVPLSDGSQ